jgi:GT2 family glycosyltransferase
MKRDATKLLAVIVTHNGRDHIEACLESALVRSDASTKVVVFDNASQDGTLDLVRERFPEVIVMSSSKNLGYGPAINAAAGAHASEFIAGLNQDIVLAPDCLGRLVQALDADPTVGLTTPMIALKADPSRVNTFGNRVHYTGITSCAGYNQSLDAFTGDQPVAAVSGAAFVVRRDLFNSLGGFDASYFLYFEDTDLSLRARLAGYRCVAVRGAVAVHDFEARITPKKLFYLESHRQATLLKVFRPRTLLLLAPALMLTELAVFGYALFDGPRQLAAKAVSLWDVMRRLPDIMASRAGCQRVRRISDRCLLAGHELDLAMDQMQHPAAGVLISAANRAYRAWYQACSPTIR